MTEVASLALVPQASTDSPRSSRLFRPNGSHAMTAQPRDLTAATASRCVEVIPPADTATEDLFQKQFTLACGKSINGIVEAGACLIEAKRDLGYSRFGAFIRQRLGISYSTAEMLMHIAADDRISDHGQKLPPSWRTLYEITKLTDEE